jgi:hypothetical protein
MEAAACPSCNYPNDADFHFCQQCGYKRMIKPSSATQKCMIDIVAIDQRLRVLDSSLSCSAYEQQKGALEKSFQQFLSSLSPAKDILSATPLDITRFLVFRDARGKTQIHFSDCVHLGEAGKHDCNCPVRLSSGTVDSLIGKMRAIFIAHGRGGEWDVKLGYGNPAASLEVKRYLKAVKEEQAQVLVKPQQAKPMFIDKLVRLSAHITNKMTVDDIAPLQKFILARDQAYFKAQLFSGDRPGDLGLVLTQEILRFPKDDGLLFNHQFGKTLRGDSHNIFGIRRCANSDICPVRGIEVYMAIANDLEIDLRDGYLFRPTNAQGFIVNSPLTSDTVNSRLKSYLVDMGEYDGETAHGFRAGCAITLALTGAKLADIMEHVGWEREHTAKYYMQLAKVINPEGSAGLLAEAADLHQEGEKVDAFFQEMNELKSFALAFPAV